MPLDSEIHISRRIGWTTVLFFIFIIGIVPLIQLAKEIYAQEPIIELNIFRKSPTTANIRLYEKEIEDNSIITQKTRPWFQMFLTRLGNKGNSKVVIGRDGWLFYHPSLNYIIKPGSSFYRNLGPLEAITAFHEALKAHGVDLILLPIPGKSTIYPEYLSKRYDTNLVTPVNPHTDEFFQKLKDKGIRILDPANVLWKGKSKIDTVYMKQDTHWSPQGMGLVANYLAEFISSNGWIEGAPRRDYKTQSVQVSRYGDLYDMIDLPKKYGIFKPMIVAVEKVIDSATGEPFAPDENSPIILLGDSFINLFSRPEMGFGEKAGLAERLALKLGVPIDVIAINDGGPTSTREQLARRTNALVGKKLIIWQFATRDLTNPESQWKVVKLPEPKVIKPPEPKIVELPEKEITKPPEPKPVETPKEIEKPEEDVLIITGEVTVVSIVPEPNQVAYSECVTYIKYSVVSVDQGEYEDKEVLAVFWGMRDSKLMPAARFKPGEKHRLKLEPFEKHPELKHVMQADNTDEYELTPLWVLEMSQL